MIATDQFQVSQGAKWTPDGKKLLLIGGVALPAMASQGFRGTPSQLYAISLAHVEKDPADRDINTEEQALAQLNEAPAGGRGGRGAAAGAPANVEVKIEWDGLERRVQKLTSGTNSVMTVVPSPDSRTYAFMAGGFGGAAATEEGAGGPGLYIIGEDGSRMQRLNTTVADAGRGGRGGRGGGGGFGFGGNEPQWSRDGRNIYMLLSGGIYSISVPAAPASDAPADAAAAGGRGGRGGRGGAGAAAAAAATSADAGAAPRRIPFTVRMVIDRPAERRQVFEEAWRVMKNRFYDANMHGVNWAAAKDRYESLLPNIADTEELHNVIMEMIGELDASHTGISGGGLLPGEVQPERMQTRYPGIELAADPAGYYKVSRILRKGPADHEYVKLANGNFILAVDGKELRTKDNYWQYFNTLSGQKFEFLVNSRPTEDGSWIVPVEPLTQAAQGNLEYDNWVEAHRAMVERLSGGEIGYLHIRAMDAPSLLKFQEDLIDNRGKKALIIDERFNGGGGIDQELLEILNQRKQYQRTRGRDATVDVPRPVETFYGPMVVLQNERSASDAEMFPDGFRALGLGKVIGVPTMGAVIGTGAFGLLDGSQIRTPGSGVYTARGENMENYGVQPDIYVDNGPADFATGHDRQVEKAIEVLKAEMK
jgi:tricorn protease